MYKASMELGRINKVIKLKFELIIQSDDEKKNYQKLINKFNFNGNNYLKLNPRPFVVVDISSKIDEAWSTNQSFSLTKPYMFMFISALSSMISEYRTIKDLFYYNTNNDLVYNNRYTELVSKNISVSSGKHVRLEPCVIRNDEVQDKAYEGCIMYINTRDNFAYMTYTEMEYLLYSLKNVNMDTMALELINHVTILKNVEINSKKFKSLSEILETKLVNNKQSDVSKVTEETEKISNSKDDED